MILSFSKLFKPTPWHFYNQAWTRQDKKAYLQGRIRHCAVLEPDQFFRRYACEPQLDRRTIDGREAWAEFQQAIGDRVVIPLSEHLAATQTRQVVASHPQASRLLLGEKEKELRTSIEIWDGEHEQTVELRGILDNHNVDRGYIVDFKFVADASEAAFRREIDQYHYDAQAAMYQLLYRNNYAASSRYYLVAVEKKAPYALAVYQLGQETLDKGAQKLYEEIGKIVSCGKTNYWPHYAANKITVI